MAVPMIGAFLLGLALGGLVGFAAGIAPKVRGMLRHVVCPAIGTR